MKIYYLIIDHFSIIKTTLFLTMKYFFQLLENAKMSNVGDDRQTDEQANNYFPK
jgi:hypothetical protein